MLLAAARRDRRQPRRDARVVGRSITTTTITTDLRARLIVVERAPLAPLLVLGTTPGCRPARSMRAAWRRWEAYRITTLDGLTEHELPAIGPRARQILGRRGRPLASTWRRRRRAGARIRSRRLVGLRWAMARGGWTGEGAAASCGTRLTRLAAPCTRRRERGDPLRDHRGEQLMALWRGSGRRRALSLPRRRRWAGNVFVPEFLIDRGRRCHRLRPSLQRRRRPDGARSGMIVVAVAVARPCCR